MKQSSAKIPTHFVCIVPDDVIFGDMQMSQHESHSNFHEKLIGVIDNDEYVFCDRCHILVELFPLRTLAKVTNVIQTIVYIN